MSRNFQGMQLIYGQVNYSDFIALIAWLNTQVDLLFFFSTAGICLFIFTTGKIPFFSVKPLALFELISKADVPYDDHPHMSSSLKELLQKMLTKHPAERAGVGWCLQHEFCQDARKQRISTLGKEFEHSETDIVLTNEDLNMASHILYFKLHQIQFRSTSI